jgi:hypothetical protein
MKIRTLLSIVATVATIGSALAGIWIAPHESYLQWQYFATAGALILPTLFVVIWAIPDDDKN